MVLATCWLYLFIIHLLNAIKMYNLSPNSRNQSQPFQGGMFQKFGNYLPSNHTQSYVYYVEVDDAAPKKSADDNDEQDILILKRMQRDSY